MNETIDSLAGSFEHIRLSPPDWPVRVSATMATPATFERWPDFPSAATADHGRMGHGRGETWDSCLRSSLGEMVEVASCCAWGDEKIIVAPPAELDGSAWEPTGLVGFSDAQWRDRDRWNRLLDGVDWIPGSSAPRTPIGWMVAQRLDDGGEVMVPADAVLIGRREAGEAAACAVADTNGCAAGPDQNSALLSALLELVERDATALWWYGGGGGCALEPDDFPLAEIALEALARRGRMLRILDITSDIPVATVVAIAADRMGGHVGLGFASRGMLAAAVAGAVGELMQMELKIAAAVARPDLAGDLERWFQEADIFSSDRFSAASGVRPPGAANLADEEASGIVRAISNAGCRVAAIDFTRGSFSVPVFRAVSPDLCHWKPRLGYARLGRMPGSENFGVECVDWLNSFKILRI